jgi:predicted GIY-YIG superfamily endonuclease
MGACYLLQFPNGKVYVGITTKTASERFAEHVRASRKTRHSRRVVYNALRKYGPESVAIYTLAESEDWAELCRWERHFIVLFGSQERALGYNQTSGGDGLPDLSHEALEKRRQSWADPATRSKRIHGMKAAWLDPKHRARVQSASRASWESLERRKRGMAAATASWADPASRERREAAIRTLWKSSEFRDKHRSACRPKAHALAALIATVEDYGKFTAVGCPDPTDFVDRVRMAVLQSPTGSVLLGRMAGVSAATICNFVNRSSHPTVATLHRLAEALGVTEC